MTYKPPFTNCVIEDKDGAAICRRWIEDATGKEVPWTDVLALLNRSAWVAVSERLPEAGQTVIVADARGVGMGWLMAEEGGMDWWHESTTHWMPLPTPPEVKP